MKLSDLRKWLLAIPLAGMLSAPCLAAPADGTAKFGRVSGIVLDSQGNPLMGVSVLILGPALERVITDARGRFTAQHLTPGRYSLRVTSASRFPARRDSIRVEAGRTAEQKFVLGDIFAPLRLRVPAHKISSWSDDWKWVLRTSPSTRPVLRYQQQQVDQATQTSRPLGSATPAGHRLVGIIPGSTLTTPLARDEGAVTVLAYLRPLSRDADLLVASSMTATGLQGSSLATAYRKKSRNGDGQEAALVIHQVNLPRGSLLTPVVREGFGRTQALDFSYDRTRQLTDAVSLTGGVEVDYLNAATDVATARPRMKLEYRLTPSSVVALRFGAMRGDGSDSLLDRVGELNAFPRVTLLGYRPRIETANHAEAGLKHWLGPHSRVELAVYRDYFVNSAVWGFGRLEGWGWLEGSILPNPGADGMILNAGNYRSSGLRTAYVRKLGRYVETTFVYARGDALVLDSANLAADTSRQGLSGAVRASRSQIIAGKVSSRLPMTKTQFSASYEWLQHGRVTGVDPYGQAGFGLQPFLGIQIRQPLPSVALLPAHIQAVADFRNLLAQDYTPLDDSRGLRLLLTPAYRSFRGGFSVEF